MSFTCYKLLPDRDDAMAEAGRKNESLQRKCVGTAMCSGNVVSVTLHKPDLLTRARLEREGYSTERPRTPEEVKRAQTPVAIYDLIYDRAAWNELREAFPDAKLTDASDEIHDGRFGIDVTTTWEDYFYQIIKRSMGEISFDVQMLLVGGRPYHPQVTDGLEAALKRLKQEKPT